MGAWVMGHNIAGYLPEADTHAYADWDEAYPAFVEMCREYADADDESNDADAEPDWSDDDYGSMRATVDSIVADGDDRNGDNTSAGMIITDSTDRPISFWLVWSDDREPGDDEE